MDEILIRIRPFDDGADETQIELYDDFSLAPPQLGTAVDTDTLSRATAGMWNGQQLEGNGAKTAGALLYKMLSGEQGKIGALWRERRNAANRGLTTYLRIDDRELVLRPWEILFDAEASKFLCEDEQHPVVHTRQDPAWKVTHSSLCPLRVLVVVGCRESDNNINWASELLGIRRASSCFSLRLDLVVLEQPHRNEVYDTLREFLPHVFHFVGHGGMHGGEAYLQLEHADGSDRWTLAEINTDFTALAARNRPLQLAFLNACEAGADGGLADVASGFLGCGCGAVVSMRGNVPGSVASEFSRTFYRFLAHNGPGRLDLAYSQALAAGHRISDRGWYWPRIELQQRPEEILRRADPSVPALETFRDDVREYPDVRRIKTFVGRRKQKAEFYSSRSGHFGGAAGRSKLITIDGNDRVGKSWLLRACLYLAALRGSRVFYWDFDSSRPAPGQETYMIDHVLKVLRHGRANDLLSQPLPEEINGVRPFAEYDKLRNATSSNPLDGGEDPWQRMVDELGRALKTISNDAPLVVALDHVDKINRDEWNTYLYPRLVAPIESGNVGSVVLVTTTLPPGYENPDVEPKRVELFERSECEQVVRDFVLHLCEDGNTPGDHESVETTVKLVVLLHGHKPFGPDAFEDARRAWAARGGA